MKIVLHGQQAFGSAVLDSLISNNENVIAVCSAPNKDNKKMDPLVENAIKNEIPVYQPESWKTEEAFDLMKSLDADLCIMAYVLLIVPSRILDLPKYGSIQYHPSLLPNHRGPSSINWPISMGSKTTGISVFWPDDGLDTGPILIQKQCDIDENETLGELYFNKLFPMGIQAIEESIQLIKDGHAPRIIQNLEDGSYESWFGKSQAQIEWSKDINEVHALIRAGDPQPGAWSILNGIEVKLYESMIFSNEDSDPGRIYGVEENLLIGTKNGILSFNKIRSDGNKVMACDYCKDNNIQIGDYFK